MQILDFVVIILFLWFLWETAHSLDFYCAIVYSIVTNLQVFVAEAFYVQIFFWCTDVPFLMELTNFFLHRYMLARTVEERSEKWQGL